MNNESNYKRLFYLFKFWIGILKNNIIVLAIFSLLGLLFGYFLAYYQGERYKSELRFLVKSDGSVSGLSGMLGGLGSVLGGGALGSPLERTIEIASSDRIVGSALLSHVQYQGRSEMLANLLIRTSSLQNEWMNDSVLKLVKFSKTDTSIEKMAYPKRKALKVLEGMLLPKSGNGIIALSFDKKSGIVTLSAIHKNEEFAIVLVKAIFNKLKDFYVEQMIASAEMNVGLLQKKVDSIKYELTKIQNVYARTTDQSIGLLFQEDKVELKRLAFKEQMLSAMYAEAQKNLETFKFMNDSAIPSLTVIDMPYSPLENIQGNKILYAAVGTLIGFFSVLIFFTFRFYYREFIEIL